MTSLPTRSDADLVLWTQWNASKSPMDLQLLIKQLNPLIQSEVNRRAGSLSRDTLESQAKKLAVRAIQKFDPNRGVKLSTHVTGQLAKLSRMNYAHQKAARIPDHAAMQYPTVMMAREEFATDYGREPSNEELAEQLKWSLKKVEMFQQRLRPELLESSDTPSDLFVPHFHDPSISYAYHTMSPRQQKIFDMSVGENKVSNTAIMKHLDITQGALSYEKKKMRDILELSVK
jgi:DNA-directed RNA polymerase specialized sigma subunit